MKTQLALVALLALSAFGMFFQNAPLQASDVDMQVYQRFVQWKSQHGKNYNNVSDEMLRFNIFTENYEFVESHNANNADLTLGLTQFADMTNDEFRAAMTTKIVRSQQEDVQTHLSSTNASMQSVDWRSKGAVTEVKNQGSCGSCWAFATVATTEGLRAISEGTLENLSNQQVTSCTNIPFPGAGGCNGGNTFFGWNYIKNHGIVTDSTYPYTSGTSGKTGDCNTSLTSNPVYKTKSQANVPANNPQAMNDALNQQPLAIAVDAGSIYFQLYNTGVLKTENCGTELNHAITLVAYTADGDFWTVKNSWGASWGMSGYIQMANLSGDGVCGMNMEVNYPTA